MGSGIVHNSVLYIKFKDMSLSYFAQKLTRNANQSFYIIILY